MIFQNDGESTAAWAQRVYMQLGGHNPETLDMGAQASLACAISILESQAITNAAQAKISAHEPIILDYGTYQRRID